MTKWIEYLFDRNESVHPDMDGKHDYAVHLKTNDPQNPDLIVHVLSDWGP